PTFLRDERIRERELSLIARSRDLARLAPYGSATVVLQAEGTRGERSPADRWALFRLRLRDDLGRLPGDVYISPLQGTGGDLGPFLHPRQEKAAERADRHPGGQSGHTAQVLLTRKASGY